MKSTNILFAVVISVFLVLGFIANPSLAQENSRQSNQETITIEDPVVTPECFSPIIHGVVNSTSKAHLKKGLHRFNSFQRSITTPWLSILVSKQASVKAKQIYHSKDNPQMVVKEKSKEFDFDVDIAGQPQEEKVVDMSLSWDGINQNTKEQAMDDTYNILMSASVQNRITMSVEIVGFLDIERTKTQTFASSDQKEEEFSLDTTDPDISITSPENDSTFDRSEMVNVLITYSDAMCGVKKESVTLSLNQEVITDDFEVSANKIEGTLNLSENSHVKNGENSLTIEVSDRGGNKQTKNVRFTVKQMEKVVKIDTTVSGSLLRGQQAQITAGITNISGVTLNKLSLSIRIFIGVKIIDHEGLERRARTLTHSVHNVEHGEGFSKQFTIEVPDDPNIRFIEIEGRPGWKPNKKNFDYDTFQRRNKIEKKYLTLNPGGRPYNSTKYKNISRPSEFVCFAQQPFEEGKNNVITVRAKPKISHNRMFVVFELPENTQLVDGSIKMGPIDVKKGDTIQRQITVKPTKITKDSEIGCTVQFGEKELVKDKSKLTEKEKENFPPGTNFEAFLRHSDDWKGGYKLHLNLNRFSE